MRNPLAKKVVEIAPSGIRKFFDIVSEMPDAISLGVGEPDFDTPWRVREEGIYTLEKGKDPTDGREMQFLCGWNENGEHRNYGSVYTDTTVLGDNLLIRYFYTRFRDLKNVKIPQQPKEENDNTRVLKCPACKHEIIFDASEIGEGDSLVVLCDFCARIYELSYRNNEFLIQNRIKEETEKTEG